MDTICTLATSPTHNLRWDVHARLLYCQFTVAMTLDFVCWSQAPWNDRDTANTVLPYFCCDLLALWRKGDEHVIHSLKSVAQIKAGACIFCSPPLLKFHIHARELCKAWQLLLYIYVSATKLQQIARQANTHVYTRDWLHAGPVTRATERNELLYRLHVQNVPDYLKMQLSPDDLAHTLSNMSVGEVVFSRAGAETGPANVTKVNLFGLGAARINSYIGWYH